ncbi:type I-E CRISPR-associated protein Cas7/Cse4/CasC [Aerococcaceae bacterium NML210727]|nr:type I-E CRISPR-associated protein Cas7/Cse4/CasC [Aerococcaceae bacterium NML210727]MCW6654018.1 type I-E CRISPR-associated protein Cas7/Cse4/CasC [Aerococcaceae bacterium NML201296]
MTTKGRLFIDVHAIQTLPPSNINRDDTGSPKTALYGGVRRSRVSSQSWKRAMRQYFADNSAKSNLGVRTLNVVHYVASKIQELDATKTLEESLKLSADIFEKTKIQIEKDKADKTAKIKTKAKALFFLGEQQAKALAQLALENSKDKEAINAAIHDNPAIDVALFGRMVADDASLNEDASSQVAHAISTHAVQTEFDFFTGIDDLSPEDNAGAGMLGTVEFNSSTLYRYANVAAHDLFRQLADKEATIKTLKLFVESFAKSLPTGKVNTFANQTLPQALVVSIRPDRPINLVSAFEKPIKSSEGYVVPSIEKLSIELGKISKFADDALYTVYVTTEDVKQLQTIGLEQQSLNELLSNLESKLHEFMDIVGE